MPLREDDHRLIVGGTDVCEAFGLVMLDSSTFGFPEPKTYTVDIPGGNGVIDLTEALTGDVAYERREQRMEFACEDAADWPRTLRLVSSMLHGRAFDYQLSFDPEYTYHGRFSVSSESYVGPWGKGTGHIIVKVDADPYKKKETLLYSLNCAGGRTFTLWSGRRPVHPTIECEAACRVEWGGKSINIPAGTFVVRDVLFTEGPNSIYIESNTLTNVTWAALGKGGANASTWADLASYTWADLQRIGSEQLADTYRWRDCTKYTWADLAGKTWDGLNYKSAAAAAGEAPDSPVYVSYDWEDL